MDFEADAASVASSVSGIYSRRQIEKRVTKFTHSYLVIAVESYLATPSTGTASELYRSARKLSASNVFFAANHKSLCLQVLDTVAEHLMAVVGSKIPSDALEETSTQYSQDTQTQQSPQDSLQLLELCFLFARNTVIGYPSYKLCKLLQWLIESVSVLALQGGCEFDKKLKLQLLVLSEMIKMSAGVRIYAKELKAIKTFYCSLTTLLNGTENRELLVFSMAILARLVLLESLGGKLFSEKNVAQTVALVISVLDSCWLTSTEKRMAESTTILDRRSLLQIISIDLLCDLGDRQDILELLEQCQQVTSTIDNCLMMINLNGDAEKMLVATHFLVSVVQLSHVFRMRLVKCLSDRDVLYRVLQASFHSSKLAATITVQVIHRVIGDDIRCIQSFFDSSVTAEQLNPIVSGIVRCINDATSIVQSAEDNEVLSHSDEYIHSVELCHLLVKLSTLPAVRSLCANTISLNQSATLIQVESALIRSVAPQNLMCFHPLLSIHLVSLLSSLVSDKHLSDRNKRALLRFLQTSEVAMVLAAAFLNPNDKYIVLESLLLLNQSLTGSDNKQFDALGLAEEIVGFNQRVRDANDNCQSTIATLQAKAEVSAKTVEKFQAEMKQMLHLQDQLKKQHDQDLKDIGVRFTDQIRQKDDAMQKMRDAYEVKVREITIQCERMGQHINEQKGSLQQRESLLKENRANRGILQEENSELKRKVQALEIRIEDIAQTHSIAMEELKLCKKKMVRLHAEIATISSEFKAQQEELESARDDNRRLEDECNEQKITNEHTYKELVLLSKAHKDLADNKKSIESEFDKLRDELANFESMRFALQLRLQEKKMLTDKLAQKMAQLDDDAIDNKNALKEEQEKRCTVSRDLDNLRKAHRKVEGDMAMLEIQVAEQRRLVEEKDEHIRKCKADIGHLTSEIGKQANLQLLIHQLSSGGNNSVKFNDSSSYIARDK